MSVDIAEIQERFWSKVDRREPTACWPWIAGRNRRGYGRFPMSGKTVAAHRFAWMITNGAIPDGLCVCHRCDNPPCVNPSHLFLGTHADNTADAFRKCRRRLPPARGEANPAAKLSAAEVLEILRIARHERMSQRALARRFNVSQPTIHLILSGKGWAHVDASAHAERP